MARRDLIRLTSNEKWLIYDSLAYIAKRKRVKFGDGRLLLGLLDKFSLALGTTTKRQRSRENYELEVLQQVPKLKKRSSWSKNY